MSNDPIRIVIADDHPVVRDGLAAILSTQSDFEVVGQASTGHEAVDRVVELQPDIVLLDLEMPDLDGVEALRQLHEHDPDVRAIVFTVFDTDERIVAALKAGAKGYLLKGAPREEIFHAIRVVHGGGALLQPVVASKLLEQVQQSPAADSQPAALTHREREVLILLARGLTNKQIAAELVISERTAKFHVSSLLSKFGASNRTEVVAIAAQQGLVDLSQH
jgi:DNA-binding NarL/FixJ family response regulator